MTSAKFSVCVLPVLLGFASCAGTVIQGYEGPARADEETALIIFLRPSEGAGVRRFGITALRDADGALDLETKSVRVLPGETCVVVEALLVGLDSATAEMCFEADAGVTYDLYVGTAGTGFDGAGYREFRIDSFRLQERHSHEIVAIASAGNRDCVADLVGQIATGGGGMSTAGGRGRPLECEDSERPTADIQNVRVE